MVAPVILVEVQPRNAADGSPVPLRLAGMGGLYPYFYGEQHYRAGIAGLPRTIASLDFDGEQLGGGGVPQAMELRWSPAGRALLAEAAALYWADAPITVRIGPEGDAMPPIAAAGLVLDAPVEGGGLRITLSDAAADLKKALLTDRFAGTGGIEGPVELEGIIKSRAWGRCFNVPGQMIDRASNVWCFGDPRRAWQRFVQVRDRGVALTAVQLLAWKGTAEATFAALKGAAVADGGVIVCPSIACVKLWTQATGDLKADIEGETAGGYVETAAEIVARLIAVRSAIPIAPGALADAVGWRPAPIGWRIDNDTTTAADAISELLGDVSLSWLLIGGQLRFRRWEWTASTRVARSHRVTRRSTVKPVGTRKLGYRRNWSPMARGDLAAIVLAQDVVYDDGTSAEAWKPAQPGADVTSENTSKDTAAISGRPVALVIAQLDQIKEIDPIKTDVSALTQVTIAHDAALGALGRVDEAQAAALEKLAGDTGRSLAVLDAAGVRRDAAQRDADEALGRLGDATLRALMEADRTRAVLRDAGIVVDPATGVVRIHAIDQVADRTSAVEVKLDAQASTIRSKASVDFVQEQIALAVLDPSQVAELEPLIRRMTTAETALDGLHATVALKADALELTRTAARLTSVGQSLDALAGTIDTKASRTDLDAQGLRLTDAEQRIAALPNGASVTTTLRQVGAAVDAAGEAALRGIVAGDDAHRSRIREIAEYREEAITRIDTGLAAESLARRVLAASMGALDARLTDQARTLVTTTAATAERVNALAVSSGAQAAAISSLQEATIDAAGGIARTERTIRQVAGVSEANADATLRALVAGDAAALAARTQLAQVQEEATTRLIAGEQSAAQTKLLLEAQLGAARALIGQTADTLATADRAAASRMDAIDVRVGAVSDTIAATQARVTREVEALASADAAQVRQIDAVALEVRDTGTGLAATRAMAIADARASADRDKAQVERIDAISVIAADAAAGIAEAREVSAEQGRGMTRLSTVLRQTAGQADDGAEAVLRALIAGDDASQARQRQIVQIQTEFTTQLVANEQASAIARQTLAARMGRAEGAIVDLTTVVSTLDAATAQRLSALEVAFAAQGKEIAATVARIAREEEARAAGDHAEALARQTLEARFAGDVGDVRAAIGDEARVRAAADQAEATARQTLEARVAGDIGEVRSAIGEEARVRAAADEAEATVRQTLQAQVGGLAKDVTAVAASIGEEARVRAQADQAEAEARRVLDAKINDPASGLEAAMAQIGAVDRARVSGDEASAESIRQVRAYLDGIGSVGLQTAFEALVTRTGKLEGRYTLAIDTNGRLQGFVLAGSQNGPASFSLIDTDFLMGKGKIVFDTGTYMKVQGVGFGAAKDLIEWFGPTMAIDKCSRANALEYRTTTGDAYFGGSLSAGTLRNPGQSSSLAADAVAEVPSFGSNGRPVKYVASWSYYREWTAQYAGTADGLKAFNAAVASFNAQSDDGGYTYFGAKNVEQPSSSITLTRSFGAAYQQLQQQSFTTQQQTMVGLKPITNGEPGNATFTASIGGGFTVLDPTQSTANRTLRLALARGFTLSDGVIQRLSIVAIEE